MALPRLANRVLEAVAEESNLWDFSISLYARAGVEEACLWLQDRHGVDVGFLLFLIWANRRHGRLPEAHFERALAFSRSWSRQVTARLRALRRALKTSAPASRGALRNQIMAHELEAERLQQRILERLAGGLSREDEPSSATITGPRDDLLRYLSAIGVEADEAIEMRLATIVAGAVG